MSAPSWTGDIFAPVSGGAVDGHPRAGRVVRTADGNEYIWLFGVASLTLYDAVTYLPSTYATTRLVVNKVGPVAVAMSANTSTSNYSWFQIKGNGSVNSDTVAGADVPLYVDGTAGRVDDATSAGDWVVGMCPTAADATNILPVYMDHPWTYNSGYLT